ncbi:MAG: hypothetical protein AB7E47_13230 [Desulfovibrionaceae bacterium]
MYHICLFAPEGHPHALCFAEVALLLRHAFADCGKDCTYALNRLDPARTNVLLGCHFVDDEVQVDALRVVRYIPYQLEQLHETEGVWGPRLEALLRGAAAVWDYCPENVAFLAGRGIEARLLPLGWHRALARIPDLPEDRRDIDALFYGSMSPRRQQALEAIAGAGVRVHTAFGVYAADRDALVARSRMVLNIHQYPMQIMETVRLSYLFNNGVFVLSEDSPVNPYRDVGLAVAPYDRLADACRRFLDAPPSRLAAVRRATRDAFRSSLPMAALLERVLADP